MNPEEAIELGREAIKACLMIGGPILFVSLIIGLLIGVGQAMIQVQDQSVSFVPKLLALILLVGVALPWLTDRMLDYSHDMFSKPLAVRSAPLARKADLISATFNTTNGPFQNSSTSSSTSSTSLSTSPPPSTSRSNSVPALLPVSPPVLTNPAIEPSKSPFQLPSYRYSRLPQENKGG